MKTLEGLVWNGQKLEMPTLIVEIEPLSSGDAQDWAQARRVGIKFGPAIRVPPPKLTKRTPLAYSASQQYANEMDETEVEFYEEWF